MYTDVNGLVVLASVFVPMAVGAKVGQQAGEHVAMNMVKKSSRYILPLIVLPIVGAFAGFAGGAALADHYIQSVAAKPHRLDMRAAASEIQNRPVTFARVNVFSDDETIIKTFAPDSAPTKPTKAQRLLHDKSVTPNYVPGGRK